ncbi:Mediator of RNA polymerase II transcription subunit 4 [Orchesella cincta]|uniref:Mediator of RNA polymerase II transcription subunit 4 n=1 Tax=Orchesella cincta TaxID=48709 RepID=A0A1D2NHL7_ORCCI|nr:Mediator of RNA polymerase II transcription subunit 4 [Orchesella cincta]
MSTPRGLSTKEKLLGIVDDVETIVKELLETTIAQKQDKLSHGEQSQIIQLLMSKNDDFKSTLNLACEQQEIDQKMLQLASEVYKHDQEIQMLQKHLKEADTLLSTALFQAKQKLDQIQKAQTHQVGSEDLIRFAHRISSTNAVAAPATWAPGDPRRPYPTDIEMRMGLLARINDMPISQVLENMAPSTRGGEHQYPNFTQQPWYVASSDVSSSVSSLFANIPEPTVRGNTNHDDVEVMSTDSSSSSSSDSQ